MSWYADSIFDLMAKAPLGQGAYATLPGGERVNVQLPMANVFQEELGSILGAPVPRTATGPLTIEYTQPATVPSEVADGEATAAALTLDAFNQNQEGDSDAVALRIRNGVADIKGICPIGTIIGVTIATTAQGWAVADGVANSVANGGSGKNAVSKYLKFGSNPDTWASSGATGSGQAAITVSAPNTTVTGNATPGVSVSSASTGITVDSANVNVNVTINSVNSAVTGISVAAHSALSHSGSGTANTSSVNLNSHLTDGGSFYATAAGTTHLHTVAAADIAALLGNHTISAHSVTDPGHTHAINGSATGTSNHTHSVTDPGHTHTGTVDAHNHSSNHSHTATDAGHTHALGTIELDRIELIPYERVA